MANVTRRQESKRWEVLQLVHIVVAYGQTRERQMKNKSLHHFYDCAWASLYGKEYGKLGRWTQSVQVNNVRVGGSGSLLFPSFILFHIIQEVIELKASADTC